MGFWFLNLFLLAYLAAAMVNLHPGRGMLVMGIHDFNFEWLKSLLAQVVQHRFMNVLIIVINDASNFCVLQRFVDAKGL